MNFIARVLTATVATALIACGGAPSEPESDADQGELGEARGAQAQPQSVKVVVKAKDSRAAEAFLSDFVDGFRRIVDIDRRDQMSGASSNDEIEQRVYKARRNDGSISCKGSDECTFDLKVTVKDGKPVSVGDRNTWAGQLLSILAEYSGSALDGNQSQNASVTIGKKGTVPSIECKAAGAERGLQTAQCTFKLK